MNRSKSLSFFSVLMLAIFSASACSGPKGGVGCVGAACGGGNGTVAVIMVADTLPASPSLLTFQVTITSLKFTTSTGTSTTVNLSPALTVDLMRLQSDSVFLGTFANITAAQYSSVTLILTGNANITFLNDTGATLSTCPATTICPLSVAASSNPVANVSFMVSQNAVTGIGIDLNFAKAVSISGTSLAVNFSNNNVLSAFTLPRANSNLASGQLDLIEDFTGVVSINNSAVTIASATATGRGSLTATASSSTILDSDPTGVLCPVGTTQLTSCVKSNQAASMDVVLKSDGTLAIQEIEPLLGTLQDTVEGILVSINSGNQTQFKLVITNLIPVAQTSLIGTLKIGDGLTVNLANAVKPFLVDTKGLPVASQFAAVLGNFSNQTNTSALHLGQTVAVHVTAFTAAQGTTIASSTADTVTLRWTRFTAATSSSATPQFSITTFPSFFNGTGIAQVQSFPATNLDGIAGTANLIVPNPVAMRALFIENTSNSAVPAFFAAKVRQH
ncbi:MAG TPA: hypothetical protein VIX11_02140 [Candidatus Acidoferrum sp.]